MTAPLGCVLQQWPLLARVRGRSGGCSYGFLKSGVGSLFVGDGVGDSNHRAVLQSIRVLNAVWLRPVGPDRLQCPPTLGGNVRPAVRVRFTAERTEEG